MNVLVVGGAGYLGGALTDILSGTDHEVRVYDSLLFEETYLKDVPFVLGDVRDHKLLRTHLEWADAVIWLAALVGDGACALDPDTTRRLNEESVRWLADRFDGRIIFLSTCSVYGVRGGLCDEETPTNPLSLYAETKLAAEAHLRGKNAVVFRLGTLFGLGDTYARIRLDLVVNTLTTRALSDRKLQVFGGDQYRPLLHVKDAALAIAGSLSSQQTGVFNLHRENVKVLDIAHRVKKVVRGVEIEVTDAAFQDLRSYQATSEKAARLFGFTPRFGIEDGIRELKQVVEERRVKDLTNPRYRNREYLRELNGTNNK
jgi:nucleoside-diphosphate-sugar epimerase